MAIINLTPHDITIRDHDEIITTYPASGTVARIVEMVAGEPSSHPHRQVVVTFAEIAGLPEPAKDVTYIVSMPCAMALAATSSRRRDVVYPHRHYRDEAGRILGADQLARIGEW